MVFDYGKVVISNEREVLFMKLSVIESIIIKKVESVFSKELSRLSKDMACPIMLVRRYVRTCCENNDMSVFNTLEEATKEFKRMLKVLS